jgi:Arc/MetJ-type ribon-helix-helix transcriptional regulator
MPGRREREGMVLISLHVPRAWLEWLDEMVRRGEFPSRSEAIRHAIQRLREQYAHKQMAGKAGPCPASPHPAGSPHR